MYAKVQRLGAEILGREVDLGEGVEGWGELPRLAEQFFSSVCVSRFCALRAKGSRVTVVPSMADPMVLSELNLAQLSLVIRSPWQAAMTGSKRNLEGGGM
jgi:hypothetical protein